MPVHALGLGLEPRCPEPKSGVLPLHHPRWRGGAKLKGCASKGSWGLCPRGCFLYKEVAHTFASSFHQWAVQDSNLRCGTGYPVSGLQPDAFAAQPTTLSGLFSCWSSGDRTRTCNRGIRSPPLCPLSYTGSAVLPRIGPCLVVGGGTGIRTLGTFRCDRFQDGSVRPLRHPAMFSSSLSAPTET